MTENKQAEYVTAFAELTVPLLRARAASAGIAGRSKMNKAELVGVLANFEVAQAAGAAEPPAKEAHAEGLEINAKLVQVARLEAHPSPEARAVAYEIRDEILAAGFEAQATGDVPTNLCDHGIDRRRHCSICAEDANLGTIEETDGRCPFGNIHAIETCRGCGTEDDHGNQVTPVVQIHTAGELHAAPKMPAPDFVFNLSRLLDDPAHKPGAELIKLDGTDSRVQDFVFSTDGALDLYELMVKMIERQLTRGKSVIVLLLCRGGKHRSVAFGDNLAAHFSVEATHHHKHLPRVVTLDFTPAPSSAREAQLAGRMLRDAPPVGSDSDYARELAETLIATQKQRHELRCALAHLVGYWGVDAADKPYAAALDSVLKEHR